MPRTLIGSLLRAVARGDKTGARAAREELNRTGWSDAIGVLDAAMACSLDLRLGPNPSFWDISTMVLRTAKTFKEKKVRKKDVELVLRFGLGQHVPLDKLPDENVGGIKLFIIVAIVLELKLTNEQLDELLTDAERLAYERGYRPTLIAADASE